MLCRLLYLFYTLFCLVSGLGRSSVEQKAKWRPDIPACSHSSCSWEGRVGAALTFTTTETCICMCTPPPPTPSYVYSLIKTFATSQSMCYMLVIL